MLRDRKQLSADGVLMIVITLSKEERDILSGPDLISRGFVYVRDSEELMSEVHRLVVKTLRPLLDDKVNQWNALKQALKEAVGTYLYRQTGRRPMILPVIIEV